MTMSGYTEGEIDDLRRLLFQLARAQDQMSADARAATPYWIPCPAVVLGYEAAAAALRTAADALLGTHTLAA